MKIEFYKDQEDIKRNIKICEGRHVQQVAYSSYHDALTQICFGCDTIRTSLKEDDVKQKSKDNNNVDGEVKDGN